jgi:hypothetical protein
MLLTRFNITYLLPRFPVIFAKRDRQRRSFPAMPSARRKIVIPHQYQVTG